MKKNLFWQDGVISPRAGSLFASKGEKVLATSATAVLRTSDFIEDDFVRKYKEK